MICDFWRLAQCQNVGSLKKVCKVDIKVLRQKCWVGPPNNMYVHVPSLDINSLRAIYRIQAKSHFPKLDISFSPEDLPIELVHLTVNDIKSKAKNP